MARCHGPGGEQGGVVAAQPGTVWWPPALDHLGDVERAELEKLSPMKRNRNSPPSPCPPSAGVGVVLCFFFYCL